MAAVPEPTDWNDPCAVLEWIKPQFYRVMAGQQTIQVSHDGSTVQYGQANKRELAALMRTLEDECKTSQGVANRTRRAFVAG